MLKYRCLHCQRILDFSDNKRKLVKCVCGYYSILKGKKDIDQEITNYLKKGKFGIVKELNNKLLINFNLDQRNLFFFKQKSYKTGIAIEKLLNNSENISKKDRDLLYRLKSTSLEEINEQISFLMIKMKIIKFLRIMNV